MQETSSHLTTYSNLSLNPSQPSQAILNDSFQDFNHTKLQITQLQKRISDILNGIQQDLKTEMAVE
jgi:hypothetical protein